LCPDAIPKKRGPKTDVLEALLKRVNGLEKRLKDEQKPESPPDAGSSSPPSDGNAPTTKSEAGAPASQPLPIREPDTTEPQPPGPLHAPLKPIPSVQGTLAYTEVLLDTFFARLHNKPYYILDENATRQRMRDGRLPPFLVNAIHAVTIKYVPHLCGGQSAAIQSSQDHVMQARSQIDVDEPNIDNLQALLLLAMADFSNGRGKRCYMVLTRAVSMAFALNLHRELPSELRIAASEREGRRKLFWTCYLMDRFTVSGSKRPSLISDESIYLRLPAWRPASSQVLMDGNFFPNGSSLPYASGISDAAQGSGTMLVEIVRVLGVTNRHLAAGGVKGDSHFPWHAQSTLSRIRSDLDYWAAATQDSFTSVDTLFGSPDSSTLVLSKLIYHLIHCLIYRPFLPIDLAELTGTGQHQSWQIEATNLCFLHANAVAELIEIGKNTALLDWPSFVGYAVCTAGTIHVHGAHYVSYREGDAFSHSSEYLEREIAQLSELRTLWGGVQHQRHTLQAVFTSHAQLVRSLASNPMRFSPVFQMEDFFDRYAGSYIDGAHVSFTDIAMESMCDVASLYHDIHHWTPEGPYPPALPSQPTGPMRKSRKRRSTTSSLPYPTPRSDFIHCASIEEEAARYAAAESDAQSAVQDAHEHNPMLFPDFSANAFPFSPIPATLNLRGQLPPHDAFHGRVLDQQTPGGFSGTADAANPRELESDPFLSLLEQLAENDSSHMYGGYGGDDFDYFLTAQE
jgi:hypothetical protein